MNIFPQCFQVLRFIFSCLLWGSTTSLFHLCHKHSYACEDPHTGQNDTHINTFPYTIPLVVDHSRWEDNVRCVLNLVVSELFWTLCATGSGVTGFSVLDKLILSNNLSMTVTNLYLKLHPHNSRPFSALPSVRSAPWRIIADLVLCLWGRHVSPLYSIRSQPKKSVYFESEQSVM